MGCGSSSGLDERKTNMPNNLSGNGNDKPKKAERKSYRTVSYKGVTILQSVQELLPVTTSRNEIKEMVYNSIEHCISKGISGNNKGKLTSEQIEGIIDMMAIVVSSDNDKKINDKRLDNVKAVIGFYEINKENVKKLFFKGKKPTEEEIEDQLNSLSTDNDDAMLLVIEVLD